MSSGAAAARSSPPRSPRSPTGASVRRRASTPMPCAKGDVAFILLFPPHSRARLRLVSQEEVPMYTSPSPSRAPKWSRPPERAVVLDTSASSAAPPRLTAEDRPPPSRPLEEVLAEHRQWIDTHGREGARADLSSRDLRQAALQGALLSGAALTSTVLTGADLRNADLQRAVLSGADLRGADLTGANLQDAEMAGANLQDADLADANLRNTHLRQADLTGTRNLTALQVGGANLQGMQPEDLLTFDGLEYTNDSARHAGKLFATMLLACAFSALIAVSTTDAQFLTDTGTAKLPV